jgi:chaperonin GroEL
MKEKKARIEDALHATRAALDEGIVPGGGVALLRCISALEALKLRGDEQTGVKIVREALQAPLRQIAANAGHNAGVVVHKVLEKSGPFGFNADTGEYGDLMRDGVIDPTKVVRCALENGSSVARVLLSTEVCITEKPKEDEETGPPPGMDEDMDY